MYKLYRTQPRPMLFVIATALMFCVNALLVPVLLSALFPETALEEHSLLISTVLQIVIVGGFAHFMSRTGFVLTVTSRVSETLRHLPKALLLAVFLFLASRLTADGIRWTVIGLTGSTQIYQPVSGMDDTSFLIALAALGLIPAIFEELYYRAVSYHYLRGRSEPITVLISTLCFALPHIPAGWPSVISAVFCGAALMRLYMDEFDIRLNILVHFLFNALNLYFTYRVFWITDCVYISVRASSAAECSFRGLLYLAGSTVLIILYIWLR